MAAHDEAGYEVDFLINDQAAGYPVVTVHVPVARHAVERLVHEGYLVLPRLLDPVGAHDLANAVRVLAEKEAHHPDAELLPGQNIYLRSVLDKDVAFHRLLRLGAPAQISRAVLGPRIWMDVEARLTFAGVPGIAVPWHNHIPVIPEPRPPFFSYPHQVHCLIYLDRVGADEGYLYVLPRSHLDPRVRPALGDNRDLAGQRALGFAAGDGLLMHGNLWHRVGATTAAAGMRRLLLLGYVPSWIRADTARGVKADGSLVDRLRRTADPELHELLGGFSW